MKKILLPIFIGTLACFSASAEEPASDFAGRILVIHHTDGTTTEVDAATVDYLDFKDGSVDPIVPAAPKVGDYFYSDGTWSDGGLVSINPDGTDPVWAEVRPAPLSGKKVVGIVCNVDPSRIAQADLDAGYTHGYVLACKNAYDPSERYQGKTFKTVRWVVDEAEFEETPVAKSAKTWYQTINGRENTEYILNFFGSNAATKCPAFYYSSVGFSEPAPEGTSGWFLPSTGQLWDALANFCGNDVATLMKEWRNISYAIDAGYCDVNPAGENPLTHFNHMYELVPEENKDVLQPDDNVHKYACLWTANRYNNESACEFNIGIDYSGKNLIEGYPDWLDADCFARPMLAF